MNRLGPCPDRISMNTGTAEREEVAMANEVVRRDPFASSVEGFTPFRRIVDRFFDDPFFRPMVGSAPFSGAFSDEGSLALDVYEQDGKPKVEASLPGFKKDEVDVQVHDGVLSIKAQRSSEREEASPAASTTGASVPGAPSAGASRCRGS